MSRDRPGRSAVVVLAAALIASACATGRNVTPGTPGLSVAPPPARLAATGEWSFVPGRRTARPLAVPLQRDFAAVRADPGARNPGTAGSITAFDSATGRGIWAHPLKEVYVTSLVGDATPQAGTTKVFALTSAVSDRQVTPQMLRVLDATSGRLLWDKRLSPERSGADAFVRADRDLVVVSDGGSLSALSPRDGGLRWRIDAEATDVDLAGDAVVVESVSPEGLSTLSAYSAAEGRRLWHRERKGAEARALTNMGTSVTGDNVVSVGPQVGPTPPRFNVEGTLTGYDLQSGEVRWTAEASGAWDLGYETVADPASGVVLHFFDRFATTSGKQVGKPHVRALDAATGKVLWALPVRLSSAPSVPMAVAGGTAYFVDGEELRIVDARTGKVNDQRNVGMSQVLRRLVVVPGALILADNTTARVLPAAS